MKKFLIALAALSLLVCAHIASAAPTSTPVQNLIITGLSGNGTKCLHLNNIGLVGLATDDCGTGGGLASGTFTNVYVSGGILSIATGTASATISLTTSTLNSLGYVTGSGVAGDCVKWGTSSTLVDALAPCGSGSGSSSVAGPLNVTGPNGTSTIYGNASTSYIYSINGNPQMPSPTMLAAGALCGTSYPIYDAGQCFMAWQSYLGAAATVDFGPYTYNYSYPIINKYYNFMSGHGQTLLSFTPSYYRMTAASSTSEIISYSSVGSPTYFNGEAVTAVGASLPAGVVIGKLYYVGSLTSSTLKLYTDSGLSSVVNITGTGTGTLETPAVTFDAGQNPSYGWGSCGVSYNGPNNGSSTGIFIGGPNGARSMTLCNGSVTHFYYNIEGGDNSYFITIDHFYSYRNAPNSNATTYGGLFWMDASGNSGEEWNFREAVFADAIPANDTNAVNYAVTWMTSGFVDVECNGTSFDDAGIYFNVYDGQGNSWHENNCHHENPGSNGGGWGAIIPFSTNSGNPNVSVDVDWTNVTVLNNANGGSTMPMVMNLGPGVMFGGNGVSVQNNSYVGASQIPVFATLAAGDYFTMSSFHNIGDTPGVQYMYGTRSPTAGYISNAPLFNDSTMQVTGNFTYYNGYIGNPTVSTVSSTLLAYSPNYQICNATSTANYTLPTVANNTGLDFDIANRGTANCTITATNTNFIFYNNATSTSLTLTPGQAIRLIDDATYWIALSNLNFASASSGLSSYNVSSANSFITVATTTTSAVLTFATSSISQFSNDSGYVTSTTGGTLNATTTVIDVRNYGVKFSSSSADATTNDTGFAAAITAASTTFGGAVLVMPTGTAYTSQRINLCAGCTLKGQGMHATRLITTATSSVNGGAMIFVATSTDNWTVQGFELLGPGETKTSGSGIYAPGGVDTFVTITDMYIHGFPNKAIWLVDPILCNVSGNWLRDSHEAGLFIDIGTSCNVNDNYFSGDDLYGVWTRNHTYSTFNSNASEYADFAYYFESSANLTLNANGAEVTIHTPSSTAGFAAAYVVSSSRDIVFNGDYDSKFAYLSGNSAYHYYITNSTGIILNGVQGKAPSGGADPGEDPTNTVYCDSNSSVWNVYGDFNTNTGGGYACNFKQKFDTDGSAAFSSNLVVGTTTTSTAVLFINGSTTIFGALQDKSGNKYVTSTTSGLSSINNGAGSAGNYNIFVSGTGLTLATGTASTTLTWTNPGYITTSTGLTVSNFATSSISQWVNDSGYVTSTGGTFSTSTAYTWGALQTFNSGITVPATTTLSGNVSTTVKSALLAANVNGILGAYAGSSPSPCLTNGAPTTLSAGGALGGCVTFSTVSTSTANTWSALQTFTGGATFNSTATFNSSTIITNVTSSILSTDSTGRIVATTTGAGANPTASVGVSAVNGSANTFMRSDAAPAINQAATFSFSALGNTTSTANISAATLNVSSTATFQGTSTVSANLSVKQIYEPFFDNGTSSASSATINWDNGNKQILGLATTSQSIVFSNVKNGASYTLWLMQDGTGSRTITWPSSGNGRVQWATSTAPTLSTGANKMDAISFQCFAPHTTTTLSCYGMYGVGNFAQ